MSTPTYSIRALTVLRSVLRAPRFKRREHGRLCQGDLLTCPTLLAHRHLRTNLIPEPLPHVNALIGLVWGRLSSPFTQHIPWLPKAGRLDWASYCHTHASGPHLRTIGQHVVATDISDSTGPQTGLDFADFGATQRRRLPPLIPLVIPIDSVGSGYEKD